jgi:hypothetical protein
MLSVISRLSRLEGSGTIIITTTTTTANTANRSLRASRRRARSSIDE